MQPHPAPRHPTAAPPRPTPHTAAPLHPQPTTAETLDETYHPTALPPYRLTPAVERRGAVLGCRGAVWKGVGLPSGG
jgi:hypothetical protein